MSRDKATCPSCGSVLAPERVRAQLSAERGGADVVFDKGGRRTGGARLLAVVTLRPGEQGRQYRLPEPMDYEAVWRARRRLEKVAAKPVATRFSAVPDEPLPPIGTLGFRVQRYGMQQWGDLFTARQKLALHALQTAIQHRGAVEQAIASCLALAVSRQADYLSSICTWHYHNREKVSHTFSRQALPFVSDFVETVFSRSGSGGWDGLHDWMLMAVREITKRDLTGAVELADACKSPLPDRTGALWFTDPPYYDATPYSDLSDFFFVWLKRALPDRPLLRDPFDPDNPQ